MTKSKLSRFWQKLSEIIFSPRIDDTELVANLAAIKNHLPTPVFWLLGKTQSGKTSVVRALTARTDAEIGNGFQPCTRTASLYDFPDSEHCILRFLDTRGLGEVDYDPSDDLKLFQQQAHVIIVVIKAMDHAQQGVLQALRDIVRNRPHWPVIALQTALHEGYPSLETEHLLPYPYTQMPFPTTVPRELKRSLLKQRDLFKGIDAQFIPLDFTLPEDGYTPVNYGLDALWETLEYVFPFGIRGMVIDAHYAQFEDICAQTAHPHIITYALLAGSASLVPIPFADVPLILLVQAKMFQTLASIYNQELTSQRFAEVTGLLGTGYLTSLGGRELIKFVPWYGSAISSVYTAATTYALGKAVGFYFRHVARGDLPDKELFAKIYAEELAQGREILGEYMRTWTSSPPTKAKVSTQNENK